MPLRWLLPAASALIGVSISIVPLFGDHAPVSAAGDWVNHVALVAAALETLRTTHALPISSNAIQPGLEYPYFLFGNQAFYLVAALISALLGVPAYLGAGITLALAFAAGVCGIYALASRAGMHPYVSAGLGFLYATGPYLSLNLVMRSAFTEYVAWQMMPVLLLALRHALRPATGTWGVLGGALALAAPFYLHKLVAPHAILTLAILALNQAASPFRLGTPLRLALIGGLAILFSVPGWYPAIRGLDAATTDTLGGVLRPGILNPSVTNLFWPWLQHSLPDHPDHAQYGGRFGLQIGLVPVAGLLAASWILLTRPRLALARRLPVPLLLFGLTVVLILDWFSAWDFTPSPLRYLQFSYRLIGLAHFLGFVLLVQALGSPRQKLVRLVPTRLRPIVSFLFIAAAMLAAATYWHRPPPTSVVAATIQPRDLNDFSAFFRRSVRSTLSTDSAIPSDRLLAVPPMPIRAELGATNVIFAGSVPPALFADGAQDLVIRIYGFAPRRPDARLNQLSRLSAQVARSDSTSATFSALYDQAKDAPAEPPAEGEGTGLASLRGMPWNAMRLAEVTVAAAGPVELRIPLDESLTAFAIECGRGVPRSLVGPPSTDTRAVCLEVDYLAAPNEADRFVVPEEIPSDRQQRSAFGTTVIDTRDLPAGHYLLPTLDYTFVRLTAADGSSVPTYHFDRRSAFRHSGGSSYTVGYDLTPERLALGAGAAVFVAYAVAARLRRSRRGAHGSGREGDLG